MQKMRLNFAGVMMIFLGLGPSASAAGSSSPSSVNGAGNGALPSPSVMPSATQTCVACHGANGISINPAWPNLAGQKSEYLVNQLKNFREGRRMDPVMGPLAKTLAEQDLSGVADYFSSLKAP